MTTATPVRRALLSVSDKTGLEAFARRLAAKGVELVSTGGTATMLRNAGLAVRDVSELTGFPEMMDGRVKTLHPKVHGGLLARRDNADHVAAMKAHDIAAIDLLVVNLYPFEKTVAAGADYETCVENIDIGGPAMIRAAAKNHAGVAVITDPSQYPRLLDELSTHGGATTAALRARLAFEAFARTAAYDAAITAFFAREHDDGALPDLLALAYRKASDLRYGENPHQHGAAYTPAGSAPTGLLGARQHHGKALSYNNLNDAAAAILLADELAALPDARGQRRPAAVVVKHANPCGAAVAQSVAQSVELALRGDPVAAYGGIVAIAGAVDRAVAEVLTRPGQFLEVVLARRFDDPALELLRARWANVRLLSSGE